MKSYVKAAFAVSLLSVSSLILPLADVNPKGDKIIIQASEISEITLHVGQHFEVQLPIEDEKLMPGGRAPVAHWRLNTELGSAHSLVSVTNPMGKSVLIRAEKPGSGLLVGEYVRSIPLNALIFPPKPYEIVDRTVVCKITVLP
jgi:hypothetical protein